ncbi:MAG: hypothetical protein EOM55_01360 [Clostridia bacterium]|nr:hypothetical protein [Clostridia bacterium]
MENDKKVKENIINFEKVKGKYSKKISEEEINALFLGLIKIVKKSAQEDYDKELKEECDSATENFRQCLIELNTVQMELKKELNIKQVLLERLEVQQEQICLLLKKLTLNGSWN